MYSVGDFIVYSGTGVCRVESITAPGTKLPLRALDNSRRYYVLKPMYQTEKIYTPVDNPKVFMRPVITSEEAERLIDMIPTIQAHASQTSSPQELKESYQTATQTFDCADLIELTMCIYAKKQLAEQQKRKIGQVDERYMRRAEELLHGEFSVALGIEKDEVAPYIAKRVAQLEPVAG